MHIILLSGGSGKRLWPLSNSTKSKQFLKLLPSGNGDNVSMVQRVYGQLNKSQYKWDSITITAGASQKEQLNLQLGNDVNIVIEPERRDTYAAIVLASSFLYNKHDIDSNETIAVLPVDSFVDEDFFNTVGSIRDVLNSSDADLVLLGAKPTFPSEKYGYIVPGQSEGEAVFSVEQFAEKPKTEVAEELIRKGALWNCGVFGFKLKYLLRIIEASDIIDTTQDYYDELLKKYSTIEKNSFDYAVVENADDIKVIKYGGAWKDLGTWETFTEEMADNYMGNAIYQKSLYNTHIINDLNIPIAALGLKNIVIAVSQDGIMVAEKGETYRLKDVIGDLNQRPMKEDRRWGKYEVLDYSNNEQKETLVKKLNLDAGKQISYQYHKKRREFWNITSGKGILYKDGIRTKVTRGDSVYIDPEEKHGIYAMEDMVIIEVQMGSQLTEEDIVRIDVNWDPMVNI